MKTYDLNWSAHRLLLGKRTCIMGILNVTPDSFSDGGHFFDVDAALSHANAMIAAGADILDIGGESSRPFSDPVPAEEEMRRVIPVIEHLAARITVPISIDTTKASVARRAAAAGASIINDISALQFDPDMGAAVAETGALIVLMHMKGSPKTMQVEPSYDDLTGEIHQFLDDAVRRAEIAGVPRSRIIIDPGIGFGKTVSHNLELIGKSKRFHDLDVPVLIGTSRKAFIRKILMSPNGDEPAPALESVETGTQATVAAAILSGAHIVRVHNVANTRITANIIDAIRNVESA